MPEEIEQPTAPAKFDQARGHPNLHCPNRLATRRGPLGPRAADPPAPGKRLAQKNLEGPSQKVLIRAWILAAIS